MRKSPEVPHDIAVADRVILFFRTQRPVQFDRQFLVVDILGGSKRKVEERPQILRPGLVMTRGERDAQTFW
jgi:hypothetical protein